MFTSSKRIIRSGWKNFSHSGGLSATTCFVMVMTISLITLLFLLQEPFNYLTVLLQEKADISVFFNEGSSEEDILKIKEELTKIPEVKDVEYISKEKALERFIQRHQQDSNLMKSLAIFDNPLPAHLNIRAFEAAQYGQVANFLKNSSYSNLIDDVDYLKRKLVIDRIFSITSAINKIGIISSVILVILAILIAFNTIRLTIYNSREQIKVQRLVGASNWFIRGPFLVQGIIVGILATLITLLMFGVASYGLSSKIEVLFPGLNIFGFFVSNFWNLLLIQLATGVGIGIVSSLIATRKYLKV